MNTMKELERQEGVGVKMILLYILLFGCVVGFTDSIKHFPYCGKHCGKGE